MSVRGIIAAMVTPFDQQEKINVSATHQLIDQLIDKGVSGLFILGTNGEFHMLTSDEKIEFASIVIKHVDGRVPVSVGIGANSTKEVISLAKRMEVIGADFLSIITPYFLPLNDDELYEYYLSIAHSTILPILLYNIPKITGNALSVEVVEKLAKVENIVGIKDSSGSIETIKGYIEVTVGENFSVLSGSDSLILEALKLGATGAVAATANAIAEIDIDIYHSFIKGDLEKAFISQQSIEEFRRVLKLGTIPSVLKYAVELRGIEVGEPRSPISSVKEIDKLEIQRVMNHYLEQFKA